MKQALMEIKPFMVQAPAIHLIVQSPFPVSNHRKSRNCRFKITAKTHFHQDNDHHHPYFQSAVTRASFRFQESLRSEPLFVDPYAGCFAPPDLELDENWNQKLHHYCVGTRFIDDQLLSATKGVDGAKQVVLFTDGMDTRAYRLKWPSSTVIFDVSPQAVFNTASQKLQDVGAKILRSCLHLHVPLESSDMQQLLCDKGFNGSRPSIWVFQGFPITNLAAFKEILFMVSSLAMKGCLFLGELPMWLTETQVGVKSSVEKWMYEIFMSYGFRVRMIGYDEVAKNLGQKHAVGDSDYVLFVAEHLRFSDYEMEIWRREFQRVEEEGDEDGFEEL
ncbi:putative methyltransferase Ppm1/Ppm2/Tcmp, S-adenosyl-L-methionine-dependent methyltransferase [Helianthus annuus]|uniref:Methyltransferase Ppm1/Ppm2/Tcmp, S-adenosyl-L-methionine-dependent methyltransferase n=1 Tax=Helianthus annuus TaxID=4232 RepID=A0A9K3J9Z3_HELAN|nr:putative S-adenosyl-L-methionine-dependent methyltransferase MMAR_0539 isoform X1 [Helianthus annuus]KAF5811097.1 putative methyltransferase Ppm1/Ppm2/Tcmp, S-adenosyl-L-methionine-dependent methyltransferase [Helianthus annuus]KAJ0581809.1 putative methyltransferase Ppm1/Ppm2/Tcmp, S-adenosyl-L-methionine-dependent methyltransferase [Helianthus annuus]KAJ0597777.1 putative methyltransferase Ppm1/Ppm2/Tcmp, S-adenosyl-L-methionine-dependent methyltransferase [Helianthus annuus]KAJ0758423.1 p